MSLLALLIKFALLLITFPVSFSFNLVVASWQLSPQFYLLTYLGLEPLEGHRPSTTVRQRPRSWVIRSNSLQVQPVCLASASRSLLQVFFGRPLFLFPWGFQVKAWRVMFVDGFLRVCPIHRHLLNPSRAMLYRCISADTCAAFPASYMVLTFQVAIVVVFLVDRSPAWVALPGEESPAGIVLGVTEARKLPNQRQGCTSSRKITQF